MIVKLPFGGDRLALDLRGFRIRALVPTAPPARDAARLAGSAVDRPLDGHSLAEIARGRRSATVIVPDATRRASLPEVLPQVLGRLRQAGISDEAITVLVANGTHPPVGPEAINSVLGPLPDSVRVVEHDSRSTELVRVGELRPGVPVHLHPEAVDTDCLFTVGTVRHHYFAGFGGGPKMVFPGVGGYREIQVNHGLVLDLDGDRPVRNPRCEPGLLDGNPVAEEIRRVAAMRPPDLALCLVEGREGGVAWAGAGSWQAAFDAAVEKVRTWFEIPFEEGFDLMVAGGGGRPTDSTLIQAHKSLDAACRFLKPGGEILWASSLDGGLGSDDMAPFLEKPDPTSILASLSERWVQYGHTTLRILEKTSNHTVHVHSRIAPELAARLGFRYVADPEDLLDRWRNRQSGATVAVMASGAVYPRIA